jgi:hypothetical protein
LYTVAPDCNVEPAKCAGWWENIVERLILRDNWSDNFIVSNSILLFAKCVLTSKFCGTHKYMTNCSVPLQNW